MAEAVFMVGAPASGKSSVRQKRWPLHTVIDPDEIKQGLVGYDPKAPWLVHQESKLLARELFASTLASGVSFVYDTTGGNIDRMRREISAARSVGYQITLCLIWAPLAVCQQRNRERPRTVPESVVSEIWHEVLGAWPVLAPLADRTLKVSTV